MKLSTISAAITAPITLAYASQYTVENYVLYGAQDSTGAYPNYAQSIIVGSDPIRISKYFSFFLFRKIPRQNSITATNITCQQRIRWSSSRLQPPINLSTTPVLLPAPRAPIRPCTGPWTWIPHRRRSRCIVRGNISLDNRFLVRFGCDGYVRDFVSVIGISNVLLLMLLLMMRR